MNRPKLILLVGIPGAGKTTYAKNYIEKESNTVHLSSDLIRAELYGDESIQGNPADVFSLMQKRAVEALNDGKDIIYDATNITRKDRASIISVCPKFVKIECHIIWAPIGMCIERDSMRDRTVGKEVIDRMLKKFQAPFYDEGIDEIKIVRPKEFNWATYEKDCWNAMDIPHDNHHHLFNIQWHCRRAYDLIKGADEQLKMAAWYHDIGKPYTKDFKDSKGNPSEEAHFYQHQCLGAYIACGFIDSPRVIWLISTHMDPFLNTKYYKNLPAFLKKDIDLLHEADLAAH